MKTIRLKILGLCLPLLMALGCGGASAVGGTETGTTDPGNTDTINTATVATRLEAAASALIPEIRASASSSALTFGPEADWDTYLEDTNLQILADVFGDENEEPQVVTKIRVLLSQFRSRLEDLFNGDPDLGCTGGTALTASDTVEIAFFGSISNGTSTDPFFDCVTTGNETTIYGSDADGNVRVVDMSEQTFTNTEETSVRGNSVTRRQVVYATYGEETEEGSTVVYLDLQYTQSTNYTGVDETLGTSDDVTFKSRSRITGRAPLDSDGNPTMGAGDFTVTKFDEIPNASGGGSNIIINKTVGRGLYGSGDDSILDIDSNQSSVSAVSGNYCIQMPADTSSFPSHADATNCADFETAFAWGTAVFPFTLEPSLQEDFDSKLFFEGDDTDLISNAGDNFTIPTY